MIEFHASTIPEAQIAWLKIPGKNDVLIGVGVPDPKREVLIPGAGVVFPLESKVKLEPQVFLVDSKGNFHGLSDGTAKRRPLKRAEVQTFQHQGKDYTIFSVDFGDGRPGPADSVPGGATIVMRGTDGKFVYAEKQYRTLEKQPPRVLEDGVLYFASSKTGIDLNQERLEAIRIPYKDTELKKAWAAYPAFLEAAGAPKPARGFDNAGKAADHVFARIEMKNGNVMEIVPVVGSHEQRVMLKEPGKAEREVLRGELGLVPDRVDPGPKQAATLITAVSPGGAQPGVMYLDQHGNSGSLGTFLDLEKSRIRWKAAEASFEGRKYTVMSFEAGTVDPKTGWVDSQSREGKTVIIRGEDGVSAELEKKFRDVSIDPPTINIEGVAYYKPEPDKTIRSGIDLLSPHLREIQPFYDYQGSAWETHPRFLTEAGAPPKPVVGMVEKVLGEAQPGSPRNGEVLQEVAPPTDPAKLAGRVAKAQSQDSTISIAQEGHVFQWQTREGFSGALAVREPGSVSAVELNHQGDAFHVFSVKERGKNSGDTWVVRGSDGVAVRVDYQARDLKGVDKPSLGTDGILRFPGESPRPAIDLDRFEMEAVFKPLPPSLVSTRSGPMDPQAVLSGVVEDVGARVRANPGKVQVTQALKEGIELSVAQLELGSAAVLAPPGVGKTTQVEAMARQIIQGESTIPRTWRLIKLDASAFAAGTQYSGTIEERVSALVKTVTTSPSLVIADEVHAWKGVGVVDGKPVDIIQNLKPAMTSGHLRMIAMSTPEEFHRTFVSDPAFVERFTQLTISAPRDASEIRPMLKGWLKDKGLPMMEDDALDRVVALSEEFNAVGAQPRKSTLLLQRIYAKHRILDRNRGAPGIREVDDVAAQLYAVDPALFDQESRKKKILLLRKRMREKVIGQRELIDFLTEGTIRVYTQTHDSSLPRLRGLFVGGKGLGKTAASKAYADAMGLPFKRIQMNTYTGGPGKSSDDLAREIGLALKKNGSTVLLFDELDKAPIEIQDSLLQMMDSGILSVPARSSGAGATESFEVSVRNATVLASANDEAKISEFVKDRFDEVIRVRNPGEKQFKKLVLMHLERYLAEVSRQKGVTFSFKNPRRFANALVERYFEGAGASSAGEGRSGFGLPSKKNALALADAPNGRLVPKLVQKHVAQAIAEAEMHGTAGLKKGGSVMISYVHPKGSLEGAPRVGRCRLKDFLPSLRGLSED